MKSNFKFFWRALPWVGMIGFALLYVFSGIDRGITTSYQDVSFNEVKTQRSELTAYVKARSAHLTDRTTFDALDMIAEDQFDGKYAPWIMTSIGLVEFDNNGFIKKVCFDGDWDDSECPPN